MSTVDALVARFGPEAVLRGPQVHPYLRDATEARGQLGMADAVVVPPTVGAAAEVLRWCSRHGVVVTPRGGGSGYAGGAVPAGGIVLSTERLRRVRAFEPLLWRAEVEAGLTTADIRRLARENGLWYPPDPGAAEQSHIGGNVATNAGGPHTFKYGVTGEWVTGLEIVLMDGEIVRLGGVGRKDVAGYDVLSLLVGSEGTLALITAVTLRFIPPVATALPIVAAYDSTLAATAAIESCLASGVVPAALELLDAGALEVVRGGFPGELSDEAQVVVIAEADGSEDEARAGRAVLMEAMEESALSAFGPEARDEIVALWRWRDGIGLAADSALGGKVSEDLVVPLEHLGEAIAAVQQIGSEHGLRTATWGHAGDGNLHATLLFAANDRVARDAAIAATEELFELAIRLDGSISGEHGIGTVKNGWLRRQWSPPAVELHRGIKHLFDPADLLNPGKKRP